jgi:predicted nucleotidyltransferase
MEFHIVPRTHYLVITGSYAYGTERPESDYDLRGWAVPPCEYFLSFDKRFEQNDQAHPYKDYPFRQYLAAYI